MSMEAQKKGIKKEKPAAVPSQGTEAVVQAGPELNSLEKRKVVVGTVVSDKMQKTIVVEVERRVKHSLYRKYLVRTRRVKAHDEKNEAKVGDQVALLQSRPLSRDKRWVLQKIVRKAGRVLEVSV